jgi:hypothetical protein
MPYQWKQILQTLIAGTDRLPLNVEGTALPVSGVLTELASMQLLRKAGLVFSEGAALPEPYTGSKGRYLPEEARRDLQLILSGLYKPALPEFVRLLQQHAFEWPPEFVPEALDICVKDKNARAYLLPALAAPDSRARWLARQHPEWQGLFAETEPASQKTVEDMSDADWNREMAAFIQQAMFGSNPKEPLPAGLLRDLRPWSKELVAAVLHQVADKAQQTFAFPSGVLPQLLERAAYQCTAPDAAALAHHLPELERSGGLWRQQLDRFHAVLRFRSAMQAHFAAN